MKAHQRKTVNLRTTEHLVLPKCITLYRIKRKGVKDRKKRESALKVPRWQKKKILLILAHGIERDERTTPRNDGLVMWP